MAKALIMSLAFDLLNKVRSLNTQTREISKSITELETKVNSLTPTQVTNLNNVLTARGWDPAEINSFLTELKTIRDNINTTIKIFPNAPF